MPQLRVTYLDADGSFLLSGSRLPRASQGCCSYSSERDVSVHPMGKGKGGRSAAIKRRWEAAREAGQSSLADSASGPVQEGHDPDYDVCRCTCPCRNADAETLPP